MKKTPKGPPNKGTAPARSRKRAALPTVTGAKVLEAKSRAIFDESVSPWLVTHWSQQDYGIDAMVEVTRERGDGADHDATGKRFAVQLKATAARLTGSSSTLVRVRPDQIRYWLDSTEPVLLVLCHVPSRALHWRWLDQSIVEELNRRNPAWIGQQTVSISIPMARVLDRKALTEIEAIASSRRPLSRRVMAPGAYAALHVQRSSPDSCVNVIRCTRLLFGMRSGSLRSVDAVGIRQLRASRPRRAA